MRRRAVLVLVACLAAAAGFAQAPVDPCLQCGTLYASDGSGRLWVLDPDTGTSTLVGSHGTTMFDIAATSDGRLVGITGFGQWNVINACDARPTPAGSASGFGNGLTGDVGTTDLFGQGPPLQRIETAGFTSTVVGGSIGPAPPGWCGGSSGDLALSPLDGMLYSSVACGACRSDALLRVDPATGAALALVGCFTDAVTGAPASGVFGLAFDAQCRLWGALGSGSDLLLVDPATATFTRVPVSGGFAGAFGMASFPCPGAGCGEGECAPRNHGFWHRACLGWGAFDPGRRGGGEGPGPAPSSEDVDPVIRNAADAALAAYGIGACEALDEGPFSDERMAALRELATLELNLRAGYLSPSCPVELRPVVDDDDLTVRDARAEMQRLLALGDDDSAKDARWIGEHVNNGEAL